MKIDDQMMKKAMEMKNKEEFCAFVKEQGIGVTDQEIDTVWDRLHAKKNELSDDDLDQVNGGGACGNSLDSSHPKCTSCHGELRCYTSNTVAQYDMYQCTKCGKEFKHIWEGDIWVYA